MKVINLDSMVAMSAMKDDLKPSRFLFSLEKRFLTSFIGMLSQIEKYTNVEETIASRRDPLASKVDRGGKRWRDEPSKHD